MTNNHPKTRSQTRHLPTIEETVNPSMEETVNPSIEEQVQTMAKTQKEILQLLQAQKPTSAQQGRSLPPQEGIPNGDTFEELPSRVHTHQGRDDGLLDTASTTHPFEHVRRDLDDRNNVPLQTTNMPHDILRDELRRMIQEEFLSGDKGYTRGIQKSSPLTEEILQYPFPVNFKLPNIEPYEGTSDPYEHIDHFRTMMRIQQTPEPILCQVFPATMRGQARTWFYSLPARSIKDFDGLAQLFVEQFIANRRIIKDSSHLSGIRQNEGETLKEFFHRFSTEARQIPGVDPELLRGFFLGGLRPGPFYSALMRDTVHTYADLVHRVEAQVSADEAINAHKRQFEQHTGRRRNGPESINQPPRRGLK